MQTITLHNGMQVPVIGLGVYKAAGEEVVRAVHWALEAGYRLIDTAALYENEEEVGRAIRQSGIPREDIVLTTKVWNDDQGYETTLAAFDRSLNLLQTDYVDIYLVHWPSDVRLIFDETPPDRRRETWRAMEEILASGRAKSIGVSNYTIAHLEEMKTYATRMPVINQIEQHPFWHRKELTGYCRTNGIAVENYSPLSRGNWLNDPRIAPIAERHGKTNAQILLRWSVQHGCIVIPKSVHEERIRENIDIFGFELGEDDMSTLDALNQDMSIIFGKVA